MKFIETDMVKNDPFNPVALGRFPAYLPAYYYAETAVRKIIRGDFNDEVSAFLLNCRFLCLFGYLTLNSEAKFFCQHFNNSRLNNFFSSAFFFLGFADRRPSSTVLKIHAFSVSFSFWVGKFFWACLNYINS